jgi:hypothetical protein
VVVSAAERDDSIMIVEGDGGGTRTPPSIQPPAPQMTGTEPAVPGAGPEIIDLTDSPFSAR